MDAIGTIYFLLRLGLPLVFITLVIVVLWRLWKKRLVKRQLITMGVIVVVWLCLAPIFQWLWKRQLTADLFGQTFAPKLVYSFSHMADDLLGDGTSLYVFEISEKRIPSLTNAVALNAVGFPKSSAASDGWTKIRWRHAPFSDDIHETQFLAFCDVGPASAGFSQEQLKEIMSRPSTLFACEYKSSSPSPDHPRAYIVSFYILEPETRRLIVIFSKT